MAKAKKKSVELREIPDAGNSGEGLSGSSGSSDTPSPAAQHSETGDKRREKLKEIIASLNKKGEKDTLSPKIKLGIPLKKRFLTGSYPIDYLTGGLAAGLAVFWGPEQGGKSTAAAKTVAAGQSRGEIWAWVDAELNMGQNHIWLVKQGVKIEDLIIIEGGTLEDMLDRIVAMAREGVIDGFVIDSISALQPAGEIRDKKKTERSLNDDTQGLLQRKLGQFFRTIVGPCAKNNILGILICQGYTDINQHGALRPKGGNAMKHFGQCRLKFRKSGSAEDLITVGEEILGHHCYVLLEKVKQDGTLSQGTELRVPFLLKSGFSNEVFIIERALAKGIIIQSGSWFSYKETRLGQGFHSLLKLPKEILDPIKIDLAEINKGADK